MRTRNLFGSGVVIGAVGYLVVRMMWADLLPAQQPMVPPVGAFAEPQPAVQASSSDGGLARGMCIGTPLTTENLRGLFAPAEPEPGGSVPPLAIEQTADTLQLGDYMLNLQLNGQVLVAGPEGAELLHRDIQRCFGLSQQGEPGVGSWSWTPNGWRYADDQES